jgi:hypothetical protein
MDTPAAGSVGSGLDHQRHAHTPAELYVTLVTSECGYKPCYAFHRSSRYFLLSTRVVRESLMWNDTIFQREGLDTNPDPIGFVDAKGVEWRVLCQDLPERHGRIALHFASENGKRRTAEIKASQLDELRGMDDLAWRTVLANAAVIELA